MQNNKITKEEVINLVIKAKEGDKESFGKLYSEFFAPIFRFIYFRVNSKHIAEDLTQMVFIRIFSALPDFEAKNYGQFVSWCYTIARNSVIDFWRKKKEISLENIGEIDNNLLKEDLSEAVDKKHISGKIKEAMANLGDEQQEVITLKFISGLSNKEISDILGKSEDVVRQMQCRALKALRELVKKA